LNREVKEAFKFNDETHLLPIIGTAVDEQLNNNGSDIEKNHHSVLLQLIADELKCSISQIRDLELSIVDTQPSAIGGINNEFIFSPRLDNLLSCFCSLQALFNNEESLEEETDLRVIALFDNEEVGSGSNQGAGSAAMKDTFNRITKIFTKSDTPIDAYEMTTAKSFLISADMAHAIHPNYGEKHQENHRPMLHKGVVVKVNANQRYATTAHSNLLIKQLAQNANVPIQQFVVRNDSLCGSTIGPIISANTGIRTVDVGVPQLSMHSIREMCGVVDVSNAVSLFTSFLDPSFRALDDSIHIDV
jgi:aspartyl aminopeptidase